MIFSNPGLKKAVQHCLSSGWNKNDNNEEHASVCPPCAPRGTSLAQVVPFSTWPHVRRHLLRLLRWLDASIHSQHHRLNTTAHRSGMYHIVVGQWHRKSTRFSDLNWPCGPQLTSLYYGNTTGFWLSPPSRGRRYNCTSYRSMQCLIASSESNTWWFYSSIGHAEWYPLASPPEVC